MLCLCCAAGLYAQTPGFSKDFMAGEEALLKKEYKKALRLFEKVLEQKPELHAARRYMGVCYELLGDYKRALHEYETIIERDSMFSRTLYYRAAEASQKSGAADKALRYFGKFEVMLGKPIEDFNGVTETEIADEPDLVAQLDQSIRATIITLDSTNFLNLGEVKNLGRSINSAEDEYFPVLTSNQKLMFYTTRKNERSDENLYYSIAKGENDWEKGASLSKFNTKYNEGIPSFVRDGKTVFFTACDREGVGGWCDIWQADLEDLEITNVRSLEGKVNSEKWETQAAISCDGSTLYFMSDRPGGYGRTDIWMSNRLSDGTWSEPINMGPTINTPDYEEAPFITNDGETLYFTSSGHPNIGGSDIFLTRKDRQGNWSKPLNLGPPINSPHIELGFFLSADGKTGYFSSNRPEGFGGMDIYQFELPKELYSEPMTFVEGFVTDSLQNKPIQTTLQIPGREAVQTDENGRFFLCIHALTPLPVSVNEPLYLPYESEFAIPLWNNKTFYKVEVRLQPVQVPPTMTKKGIPQDTVAMEPLKKPKRHDYLHTIFFDFDKSEMSVSEVSSLEEFIQRIKGKKMIRVEIIGYSDDVGTDTYNLKLSEERAKEIAVHLRDSNGILVNQIHIEGRGEIRDDKPKKLNRKVDVKVTVLE
jgi:outer membrane protein OmpA-like peptidoglycan-associated protein/tetratricopeptide (TPR) repeat protein